MRIKITKIKLYHFDELSEDAKDRAIEALYDLNVDCDWWDTVYDDAATIGLEIDEFSIHQGRYARGKLTDGVIDAIKAIEANHGPDTATYKLAQEYRPKWAKCQPNDTEELEQEFAEALLEEYAVMLRHEYDYLTSREAIVDTIELNEYEFTADGKLA